MYSKEYEQEIFVVVGGNCFLCAINGFLVSPNVKVIKTQGMNLEFENSDHNPVLTELKFKQMNNSKLGVSLML